MSPFSEKPCQSGSMRRECYANYLSPLNNYLALGHGVPVATARTWRKVCCWPVWKPDSMSTRASQPVEWLTDNGSCLTALETRNFAREPRVECRFTPVRSPQSNGMAESFVKTFKRDYVFCHALPDAVSVLRQLPDWFEGYNENAPHNSLRMLSPREFIRSCQTTDCPVL